MNLANKITIFRILLIPFFIASILYYGQGREYLRFYALGIFLLATVSDAVDGCIARLRSEVTELGMVLDPIADKLLIISAFISLSVIKVVPEELRIPAWAVVTVISRDIIIVLGSAIIHFIKGDLKIRPSWLGKATTLFQMLTVLVFLANFRYHRFFLYPAIFFTVFSAIDYIWRGSKQLNETHKIQSS
ncbi:MAG: CDP-alcohol phosphatidyltransferase family protein [Candidatus Omnitrophota bacterium]|nr:CDP-alcohol phosphatidyltransferase family protein [Candidatus Omnitrophota bacterium]